MATTKWKKDNHEAIKAYRREWYKKNRQFEQARLREDKKRRYKESHEKICQFKETVKCNRCGENHPACLEFHHTDPTRKEFTIASGLSSGMSFERLMEEVAKCEVLCSNCHRKHHYECPILRVGSEPTKL